MKKFFALVLATSLIGCTSNKSGSTQNIQEAAISQSRSITGRLVIHADDDSYIWHWTYSNGIGKECSGSEASKNDSPSPYNDVNAGTQVTVKDGSGKLIATGSLGKGAIADLSFRGSCEFSIDVKGVPDSDFYTIEVGDRKGITSSRQELEDKTWKVDLVMAPDSLQNNQHPVPTDKERKEWNAVRKLTLDFEAIELERQRKLEKADKN